MGLSDSVTILSGIVRRGGGDSAFGQLKPIVLGSRPVFFGPVVRAKEEKREMLLPLALSLSLSPPASRQYLPDVIRLLRAVKSRDQRRPFAEEGATDRGRKTTTTTAR